MKRGAPLLPGLPPLRYLPAEAADPFAGRAWPLHMIGSHERYDRAGGALLCECSRALIGGPGLLMLVPLRYGRDGRQAPEGGPVRGGWRPLIYFFDREGLGGGGSMHELEYRHAMTTRSLEEHREANRRASDLLLEHLNPQQRLDFARSERFYVRGEANALYAVRLGDGAAIVDPRTREELVSICYHPEGWMPWEDVALATKLALESGIEGEALVLSTGRTRPIRAPRAASRAEREAWAMERELLRA